VLIDWFTVIAQIVNFLILIALLKYLLYDRIIKAMDEREERIRARLKEAEEGKQEAEREAKALREKNREFDERREQMLAKAKQEADTTRKELTQEARQAVANLQKTWQEAIEREKKSFVRDLRKMTGMQVYEVARKALRDLAGAELEERMVEVLLARLREMKRKERESLAAYIKEAAGEVVIRSAFEITPGMRQKLTGALRRHLTDEINPHYETVPELISGIELRTRGRKIAWSLQRYLDTLEENALQILEQEAQRRAEGKERGPADTRKGAKKARESVGAAGDRSDKGKNRQPEERDEE
jgi:F-type H+-transporting ATPase subunit b